MFGFVCSTFVVWEQSARDLARRLVAAAARNSGTPANEIATELWASLNSALRIGNARIFTHNAGSRPMVIERGLDRVNRNTVAVARERAAALDTMTARICVASDISAGGLPGRESHRSPAAAHDDDAPPPAASPQRRALVPAFTKAPRAAAAGKQASGTPTRRGRPPGSTNTRRAGQTPPPPPPPRRCPTKGNKLPLTASALLAALETSTLPPKSSRISAT
jgi:hypothetical protein